MGKLHNKGRKLEQENSVTKKVLIITYYWPPAGGPGVQRVLKFVKYLPQFGWEPIILTVKNGEYPAIDYSLEKDIPKGIIVYKTSTIEPFSLFKKLSGRKKKEKIETFILEGKQSSLKAKFFTWIRSNLFIPDARIGWKYFAYKEAKRIIRSEGINVIFTSSPPHSAQLIGLKLKQKLGVKWVADFRDPWVDAFWEQSVPRSKFAKKKIESQERMVFEQADEVITVTKTFLETFKKKYQSTSIHWIPNGFDHEDFQTEKNPNELENTIVRYFGSIAPSQEPDKLIEFISLNKSAPFQFEFYGVFTAEFQKKIKGIENTNVKFFEYIEHNDVISKMIDADILLLLIPKHRGDIIPGKLFEYIGAKNPILCLGEKGDASRIIEELDIGHAYTFDEDLNDYFNCLKKEFNGLNTNTDNLDTYKRKNQTQKLTEIFNSLQL